MSIAPMSGRRARSNGSLMSLRNGSRRRVQQREFAVAVSGEAVQCGLVREGGRGLAGGATSTRHSTSAHSCRNAGMMGR